jgi:predicted transcriptional regulator
MLVQGTNLELKHEASRRSAFEVKMDVLKAVAEGCTKPTLIMYRSNTSWIILQKNLEWLVAAGFMLKSTHGASSSYAVSDRGTEVFRDYLNLRYMTQH